MKKIYTLVAAALAAFALSACGGDDSSSGSENESVVREVNRIGDLGSCTKNKFGEIVYVAETDSLYECGGKGWVATDSSAIDSLLAHSSSSEEADDSSSDSNLSSSSKTDSTDVADVEVVKVDSVTLTGFAQKGAFVSGSVVTVFGLDSALEVTKTKFTGKVSGDSGAFKVEKIALPSQFALVQVSGYYMSENTGKKTGGSKTTLNAIVDLSAGKNVSANVNLFTELEYARVKYLVAKEKFNVPAAKKRATKELLESFGAKASDIFATDISLDTTDAGNALLIASVLMQGDLSMSKLGTRLAEVAESFAENGDISDADLRAELADWASKVDSTDNFAAIRTNIKNMKLLASVPDFENFIYKFWTTEYKLGACTDSLEETIKKNENKKSDNYGAGYACTSKRWHKSTALDTDLGLCSAKKEGSFEERKREKKDSEYYVCRSGSWQKITETEFELKECTEKRDLEYVETTSGEYFVCVDKQWKELDAITYELKLCTEKRNNEFTETEKSGFYVCKWEDGEGSWRKATELESEIGQICNSDSKNAFGKTDDDEYYYCDGKSWNAVDSLTYELKKFCLESDGESIDSLPSCINTSCTDTVYRVYACSQYNEEWKWKYALWTAGICSDLHEGEFSKSRAINSTYYYCKKTDDSVKWVEVTPNAYMLKRLCDKEHNLDTVTCATEECLGKKYYCFDFPAYHTSRNLSIASHYGWYTNLDDYEKTTKKNTYAITRIGDQLWMAENLNYRYIATTGAAKDSGSYCYGDESANCVKYGRLYAWDAVLDKDSNRVHYAKFDSPKRGICPIGWHMPDTTEWKILLDAVGGKSTAGKMLKSGSGSGWYSSGYGTDGFSFTALPAGERTSYGKYEYEGKGEFFWSTTVFDAQNTYTMDVHYNENSANLVSSYNMYSFSVRCLKD